MRSPARPTNTSLYGTSNADTFDSKGYATYEQGNGGADTFIYNAGYGQVEINENFGGGSTSTAILQLGNGITQANLTVSQDSSGDLLVGDGTTGDQIKIDGMVNSGQYGVASVSFADGSSLTAQQLIVLGQSNAILGSPTNTSLYGTSGADTFDSKGYATYEQGNGGADTFLYNAGYGQLEINADAGWATTSGAILTLGSGLVAADLTATNNLQGGIRISDGVAGDEATLDNEYTVDGAGALEWGVKEIVFADGETLTRQQLINMAATGSPTNTRLYGGNGADTIDSKGFAAYEQGNGGADTFIYNSGYGQVEINEDGGWVTNTSAVLQVGGSLTASDFVASFDSSGDVTLTDGLSGDQITLDHEVTLAYGNHYEYGVAAIDFADGTSITQAQLAQGALTGSPTNTRLIGTGAADTIDSKGYATYEQGNGGADTFIYNSGYGQVEINEDGGWVTNTSAVLQVGGSLTASDFVASFDSSGDVTLTDGLSGDQITLDHEVTLAYGNHYEYGVAAIDFADGTSITQAQLAQGALTGSPTNTSLYGTSNADTFDSKGYATYEQGNGGADTFIYNAGYGQVEINASGNNAPTGDVDFGSDVTEEDLWFQQSGANLLVDVLGTTDQITLQNWYSSDGAKVQSFQSGDAETLADSSVDQLVQAMATYTANNPGFAVATATTMPTDATLQSAVAAAWHH